MILPNNITFDYFIFVLTNNNDEGPWVSKLKTFEMLIATDCFSWFLFPLGTTFVGELFEENPQPIFWWIQDNLVNFCCRNRQNIYGGFSSSDIMFPCAHTGAVAF